ncbi:MAG: hypothetical protein ACREE6_18375, partial [Limisphaerales bacterium]
MSNKLKWAVRSGVVAMVSMGSFASGAPLAPTGLLVNGVSRPLATERDTIRFTWALADNARGETQTAYQILVYSNSLAANRPLPTSAWWDSGKVDS